MFLSLSFTTKKYIDTRWAVLGYTSIDFRFEKGEIYLSMPEGRITTVRFGFEGGAVGILLCEGAGGGGGCGLVVADLVHPLILEIEI